MRLLLQVKNNYAINVNIQLTLNKKLKFMKISRVWYQNKCLDLSNCLNTEKPYV